MSERQSKHHKGHKKAKGNNRERPVAPGVTAENPVEVLVYDPLQKEKVIAAYAGENRWWYSTKMYKVYHPIFDGGSRWVLKLGRVLGQYDPTKPYPTKEQVDAERNTIRKLMS